MHFTLSLLLIAVLSAVAAEAQTLLLPDNHPVTLSRLPPVTPVKPTEFVSTTCAFTASYSMPNSS